MTKVLLSLHVLAAIVTVGTITVAASLFPRYARAAVAAPDREPGPSGRDAAIAALLHRVCRGYAVAGLAVPGFGLATAGHLGVLTDAWLVTSIVLTVAAAAILGLAVLPAQHRLLAMAEANTGADAGAGREGGPAAIAARLTTLTGVFNVLWAVVVVLMIVRPGSTTGA
jgi:hypothetical protein